MSISDRWFEKDEKYDNTVKWGWKSSKLKKKISSLIFIKVTKIAVLLIKILRFLLTYNFDL